MFTRQSDAGLCERSRTDGDFVLDRLHTVNAARDALGSGLLCAVLGEARQHDSSIESFDPDTGRVNLLVFDEARFDSGGNRGVVDVGANGFLAASDRTAGCGEQSDGSNDGGESGANDHGESPVKVDM